MDERKISGHIKDNIAIMETYYKDCADIKKKQMKLGKNKDVEAYLIFIEVAVSAGTSSLGETLKFLNERNREEIEASLMANALGISDATYFATVQEAVDGLLTGEAILFVDGFDKAVKIPDKGYPSKGISASESERAVPLPPYRRRSLRKYMRPYW